jgi:shikimate dehydrogenase
MRAMPSFRGLAVTIPHKLAVIEHLDELDPLAKKIGSVNTVTHTDGRLAGTTTDGLGALRAFDRAGVDLTSLRVLFLGAGGAVRAVAFTIADRCAPARITLAGRTATKVEKLAEDLSAGTSVNVQTASLEGDPGALMAEHDVIIQGTPLGMQGETSGQLPVPPETLLPHHAVFDMVYRPHRTPFIRVAEAMGCTVVYGIEMLLGLTAIQFELWTGKTAPVTAMREAVAGELDT